MKKIWVLLFIALSANVVFAQKIKVTSGKIDFLKSETIIDVEFTYNDLKVGKLTEEEYIQKKRGDKGDNFETWIQSWTSDREARYEPKFKELFDKYIEGKLGFDSEAKYVMHINTYFIEPGFNVGVMRKNAAVSLLITILDKETNTEVATIDVQKSSANDFLGTDFDTGYRISECYAKAGRELAKFLKKQLK
ncbi:MAG: hypothetical protein LBC48_01175 [Dysgonamonadaceae bacterium]|jgi:hypothetical protein|nr:hypothetical protein [Dysgonamonadaceae bacterium]